MHGALEDVLGPSNSRIVIEDSADTGWAPRWLEVLQEHEVIVASRHVYDSGPRNWCFIVGCTRGQSAIRRLKAVQCLVASTAR
jgi:hypothetical protein